MAKALEQWIEGHHAEMLTRLNGSLILMDLAEAKLAVIARRTPGETHDVVYEMPLWLQDFERSMNDALDETDAKANRPEWLDELERQVNEDLDGHTQNSWWNA